MLAGELTAALPVGSAEAADRNDWTPQKIGRARDDLDHYLAYVQRSIVAVVDGVDLPPDADRPYLRRVDMAVWRAPDES